MADNIDDPAVKSLNFYDKLANELKEECKHNTMFNYNNLTEVYKADKSNIQLHRTIERVKNSDKDKMRKYKLRNFKKKCIKSDFEFIEENINNDERINVQFSLNDSSGQKLNDKVSSGQKLNDKVSSGQKLNAEASSNKKLIDEIVPSKSLKYINLLKKNENEFFHHTRHNRLYLSCMPQEEDSMLVALFPETKIFLVGFYKLKLIVGSISVLGYEFKENEEQLICSPATHNILSINVHKGCQIKMLEEQTVKELNISYDWIQNFNIAKEHFITIVKLTRYESNMTHILAKTNILPSNIYENGIWKDTIGVELIEDPASCKLHLQTESEDWRNYLHEIHPYTLNNKKNSFVITGGKSLGKSTLLKYIVNNILSTFSAVACIDLDPGQSEFSVPGCLTLTVCNSPLLGPAFSHHERKFSYQKHYLLGTISVQNVLNDYLDILAHMVYEFKKLNLKVPLVVNTIGFTSSSGLDVMVDVLRIIQPSHVITIESSIRNKNYPIQLSSEIVSTINKGILQNCENGLNYKLAIFNTISKTVGMPESKLVREMNILAYLSKVWKINEKSLICETIESLVKIDWSTVAIHAYGVFLPPLHIIQTISSSLVALCKVDGEFLERIDDILPLKIQNNNSWIVSCVCLGWGVVKGIDPVTREICISTPLGQTVIEEVNMLALPDVQLPSKFKQLFLKHNASSYIGETE